MKIATWKQLIWIAGIYEPAMQPKVARRFTLVSECQCNRELISMAKKRKLTIWIGAIFLWKMAPTLNWSMQVFKIFWWCWTSFPTWQFSSLFNLQHVHWQLKATLATCGQHGSRFCFSFLWIYWIRSNKLETCQVLLALFCLNKDKFWFLLVLRTSAADSCFFNFAQK